MQRVPAIVSARPVRLARVVVLAGVLALGATTGAALPPSGLGAPTAQAAVGGRFVPSRFAASRNDHYLHYLN